MIEEIDTARAVIMLITCFFISFVMWFSLYTVSSPASLLIQQTICTLCPFPIFAVGTTLLSILHICIVKA